MAQRTHTTLAFTALVAIMLAPMWCCCMGFGNVVMLSQERTTASGPTAMTGCAGGCAARNTGDASFPFDSSDPSTNRPDAPCSDECQCSLMTLLARDDGTVATVSTTWSMPSPAAALLPVAWVAPVQPVSLPIDNHGPPVLSPRQSLLSLHCQLII